MATCSHPGCYRTDDSNGGFPNDDVPMFLEYMDVDETWVPVCGDHLNDDNPNAELTEAVANTPVGALSQILVSED